MLRIRSWLAFSFCFALLLAGCAYHSISISLPDGTNRIWIAPIQNQTTIPELDTRLRQHLRNQFAGHHTLQMVKSSDSQVILYITLSSVSRLYSLQRTFRSLDYELQGQITLHKTTDREPFWGPRTIKTQHTITTPDDTLENPVLTDQALDQTLLQFAIQVQNQLLNNNP